ncbi:hypothetical protein [Roseimicrobium sp. ORNL1]|uniref:hypothetical protein n=1 Tax=Roseimicrobium sp. ORNL1 TaxID=2711231 RepID=UPI0013E1F0C6|nr:hypothetical protein [Roseimicrobium sp. ORNL1]QIF02465.1 hypothetical protein G5S37_13330 [Roseimicrobium sp. ORNL1]
MTTEERLERIEAVQCIHAGELAALRNLMRMVFQSAGQGGDDAFDVAFLNLRKNAVHALLESLEKTDPGKAARLMAILEQPNLTFPFRYDEG